MFVEISDQHVRALARIGDGDRPTDAAGRLNGAEWSASIVGRQGLAPWRPKLSEARAVDEPPAK